MDKLLCELEGGGRVVVKPNGEIHMTLKTNLMLDVTCVIDKSLLNVLAREWMDQQGIKYTTHRLTGVDPGHEEKT